MNNTIVYHGTPHHVDLFSTNHIGTGEGVQAYGWGMYFAESKEVAEYYKDSLTDLDPPTIKGKPILDLYTRIEAKACMMPVREASLEYEKLEILEYLGQNKTVQEVMSRITHLSENAIAWFVKDIVPVYETAGNLYKVELLFKDEEVLLWNEPYSKQSVLVQEALMKHFRRDKDLQYIQAVIKYDEGDDESITKAGYNIFDYSGMGGQIYQRISELHNDKKASKMLHNVGIKAIKYLDESSRYGNSSNLLTYNYVVFNDSDIGKPVSLNTLDDKPIFNINDNSHIHTEESFNIKP